MEGEQLRILGQLSLPINRLWRPNAASSSPAIQDRFSSKWQSGNQ
jgi:hypothetical protein